MSATVVYIAGPITRGNRTWNFYQACEAQKILMSQGYAVINPMLSMAHPDERNIPHEQWMASDLPVLERCDLVVRLPGDSTGADMEVEHARKHNIPVIFVHDLSVLERLENAPNEQPGSPADSRRDQGTEPRPRGGEATPVSPFQPFVPTATRLGYD